MDIQKLIERAKELDKRATPGPWKWDLRTCCRDVKIVTDHSGQYYVMNFERWGMQGAAPSFQVYDKYEGPVRERGSHGMQRADTMAKSYPGKEHHKGFDDYPDHPDAKFIVEARQLVPELIAAIEFLAAVKTVDVARALEWLEGYTITDTEQVYTNGAVMVPLFRVKQALEDKAYNGLREG